MLTSSQCVQIRMVLLDMNIRPNVDGFAMPDGVCTLYYVDMMCELNYVFRGVESLNNRGSSGHMEPESCSSVTSSCLGSTYLRFFPSFLDLEDV